MNVQGHPPRIAVVVQRYGEEVNGGAELHARWLAEHLTALGEVHAITSCAVDYTTWADHYPPGQSVLNGVTVHRFPVDAPRDWPRSQKMTGRLLHSDHSLLDELDWMRQQGPLSTPMLRWIDGKSADFSAFIFFTYLYAPTFYGVPLVPHKALLVPTAHDEPYLRLPVFRPIFHLPRLIVYNTLAEQKLVQAVTGNAGRPHIVAGVGINVPPAVSAERFRQRYAIHEPFLLYVGRIDEAKNVPELLEWFVALRRESESAEPLKLVLIGKSHIPLPDHPDIVPLGFLSEQDKFDAISAAALVVIPSRYESLSMIALEAWLTGVPVLVNGQCDVLKQQCRRSQGGLYYHTRAEFRQTLRTLLADPALRHRLGRQGCQFVQNNYRWEIILAKYRAALQFVAGGSGF